MSTKFSLAARAAVISGIVALAGLPAFAQSSPSTAPGTVTSDVSQQKPVHHDADTKGDVKSDAKKAEAKKDDAMKKDTAAAKKTDTSVKSDTMKQ